MQTGTNNEEKPDKHRQEIGKHNIVTDRWQQKIIEKPKNYRSDVDRQTTIWEKQSIFQDLLQAF